MWFEKSIVYTVGKKENIRNLYYHVPYLAQDTTAESDINTRKITHKRATSSALSQQVTARLQ